MEQIKQAVDLARSEKSQARPAAPQPRPSSPPERTVRPPERQSIQGYWSRSVELSARHLEDHRIIAHNVIDPRTKSYDMLRTQILQAMDERGSRSIAVTSPTPGCGKTVTAINLALSIARQEDRTAMLVDLDLQRPQLAKSLGVTSEQGLLGVLENRTALSDAAFEAVIGDYQVSVLPTERPAMHSSELIASRAMRSLLQEVRAISPTQITVVDLPPALAGSDVISIVPQLDCVLLVAAVGMTTIQELKECARLLQSTEVVRLVLNKSTELTPDQYY